MKNMLRFVCIFFIILSCLSFSKDNDSQIVINRDENNGYMNVIESIIIIEKKEKNNYSICSNYVISDFEVLDEKEVYNQKGITLCGGEKITISISPGEYRLKCITPINKQNKYLNSNQQWESDYKYISLKEQSNILLNIYPQTDEESYLGGWVLE